LLEILDIIIKWSLIRLADSSNTKFAVNMFDFYASLLTYLAEQQYCLQDFEANILIPMLCEKTGISNNLLKDKVKKLLKMVYEVYDRQKTYNLIVSQGLNSKSLVAQAECLDEIADFIMKYGIDYSSEKEMRVVAKMADNNSAALRENALKLLGEAYKHLDDNIWKVIGTVTPKVQGLLEGRFKKIKGVPVTAGGSQL
jgi:cytoskeleton-associated protein 5